MNYNDSKNRFASLVRLVPEGARDNALMHMSDNNFIGTQPTSSMFEALAAACHDDILWHALTEVRQCEMMRREHNSDQPQPCSTQQETPLDLLASKPLR